VSYITEKISLNFSLHLSTFLSFQYERRTRSWWTLWTETFPCPRTSRRLPKTKWFSSKRKCTARPRRSRFASATKSSSREKHNEISRRRCLGINVVNAFRFTETSGRNSEEKFRDDDEKGLGLAATLIRCIAVF